jgi:hypothetical protein
MDTHQTAGTSPAGNRTTEVAREQAASVGQHAARAGDDLAQTTKEQSKEVVAETSRQARDLAHEARSQLREQTVAQRDRVTSGLRVLGDELQQMADRGGQSGAATEIAHQAAGRAREVARFLDSREPGDLVKEVRSYARRRPGTFLVGAAIAGVLVGRLVKASRSAQAGKASGPAGQGGSDSAMRPAGTGQPAVPAPAEYPARIAPDPPVQPATPVQPEPGYGTVGYPTGAGTGTVPGRTP